MTLRKTTRAGSGIVGISSAGSLTGCSRIAELAQKRAGLGLYVGYLLLGQVAAPAADGLGVHVSKGFGELVRVGADVAGDAGRGGVRVSDELLVAHLERGGGRGRPRCREVTAPGPARASRLAGGAELLNPLRLDPEAGLLAVGAAHVVGSAPLDAEPSLLEQGADDVASVANHVHDLRLRVGAERRAEDEARLGCLLDGP